MAALYGWASAAKAKAVAHVSQNRTPHAPQCFREKSFKTGPQKPPDDTNHKIIQVGKDL